MLTAIEQKMLVELIERRGVDSVLLAITAAASAISLDFSHDGQTGNEALWNVFADRMNDEYIWCKKHLY